MLQNLQETSDEDLTKINLSYDLNCEILIRANESLNSETLNSLRTEFVEAEEEHWIQTFIEHANLEKQAELMSLVTLLSSANCLE